MSAYRADRKRPTHSQNGAFDPSRTWAWPDIGPQFCYAGIQFPPNMGLILSSERVERRLAAVLAADVAGYSRLMGVDEERTLANLKSLRKTLVDPSVAAHRGRIVKTTGDGILVEFASAVDAARCAAEVQRGMAALNADVPQDIRIDYRIGVHVGDIIIDDNDIFGDGVNIAARLEGIAEHSQIAGRPSPSARRAQEGSAMHFDPVLELLHHLMGMPQGEKVGVLTALECWAGHPAFSLRTRPSNNIGLLREVQKSNCLPVLARLEVRPRCAKSTSIERQ
jgi:hypothetical protein